MTSSQHQPDYHDRDDPWTEIGAIVPRSQQAERERSSRSSPKSERRQPINPAIMEQLAELAMRFPRSSDDAGDEIRLRLLAEDLSANLSPVDFEAAIRTGVKEWKFLPTLAEIMGEARPHIEHRRWLRNHELNERQIAYEARLLSSSGPRQPVGNSEVLADLFRKLDEADKAARRRRIEDVVPVSWQFLAASGKHVSDGLKQLAAKMKGAAE
jgi:hypothetical protein